MRCNYRVKTREGHLRFELQKGQDWRVETVSAHANALGWKELSTHEEPKRSTAWSQCTEQWSPVTAGISTLNLAVMLTNFYFSLRKPLLELLCSQWTGCRGSNSRREKAVRKPLSWSREERADDGSA